VASRTQFAADPRRFAQSELGKPGFVLYFYATNLVALREELIQAGEAPGPIGYPDYLPKGEMRLLDPDGDCLMITQNAHDTP